MPNDCRRLLLHRTLAVHSQYTRVPSLSLPTLFRSNFANDPVFQVPLALLIFRLFASFFAEPRSESPERATQKFSLSLPHPNVMTTKTSSPLNCVVLKLASSSQTTVVARTLSSGLRNSKNSPSTLGFLRFSRQTNCNWEFNLERSSIDRRFPS